jgi:hypothetical protein
MVEDNEVPTQIKIIAPVGAYVGRVKHGIDWALGRADVTSKKTKVVIVFVAARGWLSQKDYVSALDGLRKNFDDSAYEEQFKEFAVKGEEIDIDDRDSCLTWLLRTLNDFLPNNENSGAYVDLTSAPKEWLFASYYVAEFFDRVNFYYVKSRQQKSFIDFVQESIDEGAVPIPIILTAPDSRLSSWIRRDSENWQLFKNISEQASKLAAEQQRPILKVEVPLKKLTSDSDVLKGISKRLTEIERYRLFTIRKKKSVQFTALSYALAKSMFNVAETGGITQTEKVTVSEEANKPKSSSNTSEPPTM